MVVTLKQSPLKLLNNFRNLASPKRILPLLLLSVMAMVVRPRLYFRSSLNNPTEISLLKPLA
ncbi:ABH_G0017870.mRNA.1.CDS.1 [Saccharomyces cerevisiae]|nr:ABH_G0017870.mRNA.1.CDS.1 [Saccharomyces cerevisiae]CAI6613611.1 ABH_G0017870.mRNA.1.CDS.1 [Saccharomyces cerevisiae]